MCTSCEVIDSDFAPDWLDELGDEANDPVILVRVTPATADDDVDW